MTESRRSLRFTITVWVTTLTALGLIATGVVTAIVGTSAIRIRIDESLAREIGEFRELASRHDGSDVEGLLRQAMEENVPDEHETFIGFLPDVTLVPAEGASTLADDAAFRRHVLGHTDPAYSSYTVAEVGEVRLAIMPVDGVDEHGQPERVHFVVAYFVAKELSEMQEVVWVYVATGLLALIVVAAAAWLISSAVLAPLRALRDTSNRISGSDISERIAVTGSDEVAQLTTTVNSMLDRLQEALDSQRNMLDDVGHELRTPITVLRGHLELLDSADPAEVAATRSLALDEVDRMSGLVGDLITLAKYRRPDFLTCHRVNLADIVTDVIDRAQVVASGHTFTAGVLTDTWVLADRHRLVQAVMQLIDNAVAVSCAESRISIGCDRIGATARIWVRDAGPGIRPADRERIFERNTRATSAYEGTGLGLAIVSAIATAHRGRAYVAESDATGTTMMIELPALAETGVAHAGAARRG